MVVVVVVAHLTHLNPPNTIILLIKWTAQGPQRKGGFGGWHRCMQAATAPPADWVNVRDHGAVGDGEHDDTDAIRAAIAASQVSHRI